MTMTFQTHNDGEVPIYITASEHVTAFHDDGTPIMDSFEIVTRGDDLIPAWGEARAWDDLPEDEREAWAQWIEDDHDLDVRIAMCDPAVRDAYGRLEAYVAGTDNEWESYHESRHALLDRIESVYARLVDKYGRSHVEADDVITAVGRAQKGGAR